MTQWACACALHASAPGRWPRAASRPPQGGPAAGLQFCFLSLAASREVSRSGTPERVWSMWAAANPPPTTSAEARARPWASCLLSGGLFPGGVEVGTPVLRAVVRVHEEVPAERGSAWVLASQGLACIRGEQSLGGMFHLVMGPLIQHRTRWVTGQPSLKLQCRRARFEILIQHRQLGPRICGFDQLCRGFLCWWSLDHVLRKPLPQ